MLSRLRSWLVVLTSAVTLAGLAAGPVGAAPPPSPATASPPRPSSHIGDASAPQPSAATPSSDRDNRAIGARQGVYAATEAGDLVDARPQPMALPSMTVEECRDNDRGDEEEYGGWVKDHASYCQWNNVTLKYYSAAGDYLGDLKFRFTLRGWAYQNDDPRAGRQADFGITFDRWSADPGILDEQFIVAMVCEGWPAAESCEERAPERVSRRVADWVSGEPEILFSYGSPTTRRYTTDRERRATGTFQAIFVPGIPGPWTQPARSWPNSVRFDSAWYLKTNYVPDSRRHGTIFDRLMPFLRFRTSDPVIGQEAQHIWDAQNQPSGTHPTWEEGTKSVPGKWPGADWKPGTEGDYLHRIYRPREDPTLGRKNHRTAVGTCVAVWGPDYTEGPNGEELQCDEYPFASTYEGAAKGDRRYSARPIEADHNEAGGRALGAWYSLDRIIHNDYFTIDAVDDN